MGNQAPACGEQRLPGKPQLRERLECPILGCRRDSSSMLERCLRALALPE
jgi:hypothetical protein